MNRQRGFVDLWVALPVFIALLLALATVGIILRKKIQLEKTSWFEGFALQKPSSELSPVSFRNQEKCKKEGHAFYTQANLPRAFTIYLATNCSSSRKGILESTFQTAFFTSGKSFKHSTVLRQLLWQENMNNAGFGFLPLQFLAMPELLEAIGILGLPVEMP